MDRLKINHSKWVKRTDGKVGECEAYCLRCGRDVVYQIIDSRYQFENYCPHCGAKMDLKITDFEFERLSRQEKELEKLRKNSNVKKLLVDYQVNDGCINSDSYGAVCVKCGRCGRTFTKDGFLKESENK